MSLHELSDRTRVTGREQEGLAFLGKAISELTKSPLIQEVARAALEERLAAWAGNSFVKKKLSAQVVGMVAAGERASLADSPLWSNASGASALLALMPILVNSALEIVVRMQSALRQYPPEEQVACLRASLEQVDWAKIGGIITEAARNVSDLHKANPRFMADLLEGPLNEILFHTDFGELKETLDHCEEDIVAVAGMAGQTLWNYPGKLACLEIMSMTFVNIVVKSLGAMLKPLENASPESLADLLFAVLDSLDGKQVGLVLNASAELLRKIHTGSVFLGEPEQSIFQRVMTNKWTEVISTVDPVLMRKAKVALAEKSEAVQAARVAAYRLHPDPLLEMASAYSSIKNPALRAAGRQMRLFEELPPAAVNESLARGVAELDVQEVAETLNTLLRLVNALREDRPDLLTSLVSSFVTTVDAEELGKTVNWVCRDAAVALKPLAHAVLPAALRGLNELLTPEPGEDTREIDEALTCLKKCLCMEGGRS